MGDWKHTLRSNGLVALVNKSNGELCSVRADVVEFMYGGGKPEEEKTAEDKVGWEHSEIIMFPVIGSVAGNQVSLDGKPHPAIRHGIGRALQWELQRKERGSISLAATYYKGTLVENPKKDLPSYLSWPVSFRLEKEIILAQRGLYVTLAVTNIDRTSLAYNIGWHPAFKAAASTTVRTVGKDNISLTIAQLQSMPNEVLTTTDTTTVLEDAYRRVEFNAGMPQKLWSPQGSSLVCIEPGTHFSSAPVVAIEDTNPHILEPGNRREYLFRVELEKK